MEAVYNVSVSSRRALSLLLLDPDQLQLFFALLVVCGQTLVLLQQLFVLLHQTGRVLLVLLILVQFSDELLFSLDQQGDLCLHFQVFLGHLAVLLKHSHGLFGVGTGSERLQLVIQGEISHGNGVV